MTINGKPQQSQDVKEYAVLIVEDDFRVADINRQFIEQSPGFSVVCVAKTRAEAVAFLEESGGAVDLVLLDAYIPDVSGLDLLWEMRSRWRHMDIVMITAAKEVETIQEALRGGVFDYLIKPTESERMTQMLQRFRHERSQLAAKSELSQAELDQALMRQGSTGTTAASSTDTTLPKGIDRLTLESVVKALEQSGESVTAVQLAQRIGTSRSTARRYLEYLVSVDQVTASLGYGDVGRPERHYRLEAEA